MNRYIITVDVDEEVLKSLKCSGMSAEDVEDMSIEGMIEEEMGWVEQSGIYLVRIEESVSKTQ